MFTLWKCAESDKIQVYRVILPYFTNKQSYSMYADRL